MVATSVSGKKRSLTLRLTRFEALLRRELPIDPHADPLRACLQHAGRRNRVLGLKRSKDRALVQPQRRDLARGKLQVDDLILRANGINPADIRNGQNLGTNLLHAVAQLPLRQAVARECIKIAVDVAKPVIERRPHDALREIALDVADHIAHAHPGRLDVARLCGGAKVHENRGLPRGRDAARVVERLQLLELPFDPIGDLARDFLSGRARPFRLDHHRLDGEVRIFLAPEFQVRKQPGRHEGDHEIPDKRTMLERPVRKVEWLHSGVS